MFLVLKHNNPFLPSHNVLPIGLEVPGVHMTGSTLVAGQEYPAGQGTQRSSAHSVLYVPVSHTLQRDMPGIIIMTL